MFLERVSSENFGANQGGVSPLIVTKDSPRKSFFKKLNRHGSPAGSVKRIKRNSSTLRGNSFAGNSFSQRVVVKINPVKNKTKGVGVGAGSGGANLYHHVHYISRAKAGRDGEQAQLFDRDNEGLERLDFFERCKNDRHHFRMIISPERGGDIDNFQGYVRRVMEKVEKDLETKLDWVSAVHYDTDDVHAHVIVRGKNDKGEDLVIGRDYIAYGIRSRAQEVATELLGERSLAEIERSLEKEVDAMRATSLDRFIEKQANEERQIDVRKANNFGKEKSYERAIKGRLRYLETTGLATQYPPGIFTLKEGYMDALYEAGTAKDILNRLHRSGIEDTSDLSIYSTKEADGPTIEGRLSLKGFADELTDRKYIVMDEIGGGRHYIPIGDHARYDELEDGALIRIRGARESSGKADYNIDYVARQNDGIYDEAKHKAYIETEQDYIPEEKREGYLDSHRKRLDTLEKNGVVELLGAGRYRVPEDVIDRGAEITKKINERERKRFYPRLDVLSEKSPEGLTQDGKVTWLDKELFKRTKGKSGLAQSDDRLEYALDDRKAWLINNKLAYEQSNGEFAYRENAFKQLRRMEVVAKGEELAGKVDLQFSTNLARSGERHVYYGYAELESGLWAVTRKERELYMSPIEAAPDVEKGKTCVLEQDEKGRYRLQEIERQKQQSQQQSKGRGRDDDFDMEL